MVTATDEKWRKILEFGLEGTKIVAAIRYWGVKRAYETNKDGDRDGGNTVVIRTEGKTYTDLLRTVRVEAEALPEVRIIKLVKGIEHVLLQNMPDRPKIHSLPLLLQPYPGTAVKHYFQIR